ncbi:ABC transporter [Salinisphaera shabanensis T35B1]|uniref:ABC transporter ATP-binding protein n=1 Tax=Salinisphaera shabanensis E1L3A TaxID=1033802 RepID=U2ESJ0_9GAMM|nr:ABC transporter ATP-binding protein [Salinisphaera shabanensis]ERJ20937.1 ABC transporter ATP-binding protein [Salinisphaera shabanensis E1L3A]
MQLIKAFFKQYPAQCLVVWSCLIVASIAEGLSLSTLLPMLSIATGNQSGMVDEKTSDFLTAALHDLAISPTIGTMVLIVLVGLVIKALLTLLAYRQVGFTVAAIATDVRLAFLRALSASRWEYFLRQRTGRLANSISTEASSSASAFQSVAALAALLSQSVVFIGVALLINWRIALLALAVGAVIFGLLKVMVSISRDAGGRQKGLFQQLMSLMTDSLSSLKPLKSMAREGEMDDLLERQTRELNATMRTQVLASEVLKAMQELLIGLVLVAGVAVSLLIWKLQLAEIMVLTIVLARMLTRLSKVQQEYQKLASKEAFYWAMTEAVDEARAAREQPFGSRTPTLTSGIHLAALDFGYGDSRVLEQFELEIPAGEVTALIGPSGAGKTTAVDLIIGLLRAGKGDVLVDGVPLTDIDIRKWRGMIGYVPQDTVLLHDTILNNVRIGNADITEADALWALDKAGASGFVAELEEGANTVVGEHGARFSGGQRQRIVIARALAHRPKLLILDEATSALDPATERAVSQTLRGLGRDYTVLAISHRPTLMELADHVYRIENGKAWRLNRDQASAEAG